MKKIFFILFFIFLLLFFISLVAFLFTYLTFVFILLVIFFIVSIISLILFGSVDKIKRLGKNVDKYYKQKRDKERELKELDKLFFKREISEEMFKKSKKEIEKELFEIDYYIKYSQIDNQNVEDEIRNKMKLLTKSYMSKKIQEDLFQELYGKYARELASTKSKAISDNLDRKIKREMQKIKREKNDA